MADTPRAQLRTGVDLGAALRVLGAAHPVLAAVLLSLPLAWFLYAACLAPFWITGPPSGASAADFKRVLDREVPRILAQYGVPGVAIGTVIHGDPGQVYTYGWSDVEHRRLVTPQTVFQVASLSKSVSAWGVLTLVDAGKVDLDQPAERYLAAWPLPPSRYASTAVTVRRLLTHTAGLNAGRDEFRAPDQPPLAPTRLLAREGPAESPPHGSAVLATRPGDGFIYSVPGYILVQMIIEHQSGQQFSDYMRNSVLRPLRMTSSSYDWDPALRSRTATSYLADGRPQPLRVPVDEAADSLFSTPVDMVNFLAAPIAGQDLPVGAGVISQKAAAQLFLRPDSLSRAGLVRVAPDVPCMGCFVEQRPGGPLIVSNAGSDPGWTSEIESLPSTGDALVVLTNSSRGPPAIAQVEALWAAWRGIPPPPITRIYRTWGSFAVVVVYVIGLIALGAGYGVAADLLTGRRGLGGYSAGAALRSLIEGVLALGAFRVWRLLDVIFELTPLFALVARLALAALLLALLARSFLPLRPVAADEARV